MRDMHRWDHLRPEEFYAEQSRAPVAYWACGPMEDHGLQNALGIDPGKAYEICRRAAHRTGGILFPLVPFAPAYNPPLSRAAMRSGVYELFAPSLFASVELCEQIYAEMFENLAELGFRLCVAMGGHGPAAALLKRLAERLGGQIGRMRIHTCGSITYLADLLPGLDPDDPSPGAHGGLWETAMNMGLDPEFADLSRVRHIDASPIPSQLKGRSAPQLAAIEHATPALGERLLDAAAHRLAEAVRGMLYGQLGQGTVRE